MPQTHTYSSREFTRDVAAAKRAADDAAVFITDRGQAAYVLLNKTHYEQLLHQHPQPSLLTAMHQITQPLLQSESASMEVDFEPARIRTNPVNFDL